MDASRPRAASYIAGGGDFVGPTLPPNHPELALIHEMAAVAFQDTSCVGGSVRIELRGGLDGQDDDGGDGAAGTRAEDGAAMDDADGSLAFNQGDDTEGGGGGLGESKAGGAEHACNYRCGQTFQNKRRLLAHINHTHRFDEQPAADRDDFPIRCETCLRLFQPPRDIYEGPLAMDHSQICGPMAAERHARAQADLDPRGAAAAWLSAQAAGRETDETHGDDKLPALAPAAKRWTENAGPQGGDGAGEGYCFVVVHSQVQCTRGGPLEPPWLGQLRGVPFWCGLLLGSTRKGLLRVRWYRDGVGIVGQSNHHPSHVEQAGPGWVRLQKRGKKDGGRDHIAERREWLARSTSLSAWRRLRHGLVTRATEMTFTDAIDLHRSIDTHRRMAFSAAENTIRAVPGFPAGGEQCESCGTAIFSGEWSDGSGCVLCRRYPRSAAVALRDRRKQIELRVLQKWCGDGSIGDDCDYLDGSQVERMQQDMQDMHDEIDGLSEGDVYDDLEDGSYGFDHLLGGGGAGGGRVGGGGYDGGGYDGGDDDGGYDGG